VVHLHASNNALQKQIKDEKLIKVKLAAEVTDLNNQIQRMQIDRNKLLTTLSEKVCINLLYLQSQNIFYNSLVLNFDRLTLSSLRILNGIIFSLIWNILHRSVGVNPSFIIV